ncbi:hypothetical protein E2986_13016, partial [Frieseomelitta varia]
IKWKESSESNLKAAIYQVYSVLSQYHDYFITDEIQDKPVFHLGNVKNHSEDSTMCSIHDQAFLQILQEERDITNFLDAFFGFLYRW